MIQVPTQYDDFDPTNGDTLGALVCHVLNEMALVGEHVTQPGVHYRVYVHKPTKTEVVIRRPDGEQWDLVNWYHPDLGKSATTPAEEVPDMLTAWEREETSVVWFLTDSETGEYVGRVRYLTAFQLYAEWMWEDGLESLNPTPPDLMDYYEERGLKMTQSPGQIQLANEWPSATPSFPVFNEKDRCVGHARYLSYYSVWTVRWRSGEFEAFPYATHSELREHLKRFRGFHLSPRSKVRGAES